MQNKKIPLILVIVLCLAVAAGGGFLLMRTLRLRQETQQLDEQFAKELEESRKTIDKLKEQETELDADISDAVEKQKDSGAAEGNMENVPSVTPTPEPLLVSIRDRRPGEILSPESLYMENPGIYFTASQISEGDEATQRIRSILSQKNKDIDLEQLRYLKMPYYDQKGEIVAGEMIVNTEISGNVLEGFLELFRKKEKIQSLDLEENLWTEPEDWTTIKNKFHLPNEKVSKTLEITEVPELTDTPEQTGPSKPAESPALTETAENP